jgi:hypothetical protein
MLELGLKVGSSFISRRRRRKKGTVARQHAGTCLLIISRLAVMMQTPEAHFRDWNSRFQKHRNTALLNTGQRWAYLGRTSSLRSGLSDLNLFLKWIIFLSDEIFKNSLNHVTTVHLPFISSRTIPCVYLVLNLIIKPARLSLLCWTILPLVWKL